MDKEKLADVALKAAKDMLKTLPDDSKLVIGKEVLTGKEVKEKFSKDEEFAGYVVNLVVGLKFDKFSRLKP